MFINSLSLVQSIRKLHGNFNLNSCLAIDALTVKEQLLSLLHNDAWREFNREVNCDSIA